MHKSGNCHSTGCGWSTGRNSVNPNTLISNTLLDSEPAPSTWHELSTTLERARQRYQSEEVYKHALFHYTPEARGADMASYAYTQASKLASFLYDAQGAPSTAKEASDLSRSLSACQLITTYCEQIGGNLLSGEPVDQDDLRTLRVLDSAMMSNMDQSEKGVELVNQALANRVAFGVSRGTQTDCDCCQDPGMVSPGDACNGVVIKQEPDTDDSERRGVLSSIEEVPVGQKIYRLGPHDWQQVHLCQGRMLADELDAPRFSLGGESLRNHLQSVLVKGYSSVKLESDAD